MTTLEGVLSVALACTLALLVRSYQRKRIIRHLFIQSNDWSADRIDEMTEMAAITVASLLRTENGFDDDTEKMAHAYRTLPFCIIDAKTDWSKQTDNFQATLRHNGIRPLDLSDKDDLIFPGKSWFNLPPRQGTPRGA